MFLMRKYSKLGITNLSEIKRLGEIPEIDIKEIESNKRRK